MSAQAREPRAERPHIPEYGVPESDEGLLPWSRVSERLAGARNYWIVTAGPKGRPHAIPIWGAWVGNAVYFEGGGHTRWARNLAANPAVTVHLESGDDVVILDGVAGEISRPDRALFAAIDAAYAAKYDYKPSNNLKGPDDEPFPEGGLYVVRPRVVLAWTAFPRDATRFRFGDD
jgi:hypothetical protein